MDDSKDPQGIESMSKKEVLMREREEEQKFSGRQPLPNKNPEGIPGPTPDTV
jgi:hypothetical protein